MDDTLQNKLTRFEETPPAGVWNKIADALAEEENFANRLYNYTQTPPTTTWPAIEKNIGKQASAAKVIPFTTRFKKPIRYIAAASIIGLIAVATTLLLRRTEAGAPQAGSTATVPVTTQAPVPQPRQNKMPQTSVASVPVSAAIKEPTPKTVTFKRRLLNLIQPQKFLTTVAVAGAFAPEKVIKEALFNNRSLDNYMVFSDGNGMAMRMPKKLFPLVQCEDGDASCRQRIQSLQQKISSASLATDFGAIIEMLHRVQ
jgi:hypothetical protein